jgi:hypothetical protein
VIKQTVFTLSQMASSFAAQVKKEGPAGALLSLSMSRGALSSEQKGASSIRAPIWFRRLAISV